MAMDIEVNFNVMRSINLRFTYILTYFTLLCGTVVIGSSVYSGEL